MYGAMMGGGWGVLFMTLTTVLVVAPLIGAAFLVYRPIQHSAERPRALSKAEHLLAERYVRGEIDRVEFEKRRATLREG